MSLSTTPFNTILAERAASIDEGNVASPTAKRLRTVYNAALLAALTAGDDKIASPSWERGIGEVMQVGAFRYLIRPAAGSR
ncbi:hypothetical protein LTR29_018162 [Friedmanniomyces endolithicus]|nr:hypothetical protein LTR29_018162 [Friedmanniomyces endolithicus]